MSKLINVMLAVSIAAFLIMSGTSCGGASDSLLPGGPDQAADTFEGVSEGDFKAVRYNDMGYRDASLNPTIDISTTAEAGRTIVRVGISDSAPMFGAALDLHYDAAQYAPLKVEFGGLIEGGLELASTSASGVVSVGQADLEGEKSRQGEFVTVIFENSPARTLSAAGDGHTSALDTLYEPAQITGGSGKSGFAVTSDSASADSAASIEISATWATGDGNGDGATTIGDLTPMIAYGYYNQSVSDENYAPAVTDYDGNGMTNISDLTAIGAHINESTTAIEILMGDAPVFAAGHETFTTWDWADGNAPSLPPADGTTDWDNVWRSWSGSFSMDELVAMDSNLDGSVFISARVVNGSAAQPALAGRELSYEVVEIPEGFTVDTVHVEIDDVDYDHNSTLSAVANSEINVSIRGIGGEYNGSAFGPADAGSVLPQGEYDTALAAVRGLAELQSGNDGAADFKYSSNVLSQTGSIDGGWTFTVFPDDDPESNGANPEGRLSISVPTTSGFIPAPLSTHIWIDVTEDSTAPLVLEINTVHGQDDEGNWQLNTAGNTMVKLGFDYSLGLQESFDVQLYDHTDPQNSHNFSMVDSNPQPGQAVIRENDDPQLDGSWALTANVGPVAAPGHLYSLRVSYGPWNSVNKPGQWLTAGPLPQPVEFTTIPSAGNIGPDTDYLWIFHPDPIMRNNPRLTVLPDSITAKDQPAFDDTIKGTGSEFSVSVYNNGEQLAFPQIVVAETDNPALIASTTVGMQGAFIVERTPGYIVLDIAALTPQGGVSDPTRTYSFKLFGPAGSQALWPELGSASFDVQPMSLVASGIAVEDWGINAFSLGSRGNAELGQRSYEDKILDASTVGGLTPDVFFVELAGGQLSDWSNVGPWAASNMELIFAGPGGEFSTYLEPRAAGVSPEGNLIAVHVFTAEDFSFAGNPLWEGILSPGQQYSISIDDPLQPGVEWSSVPNALNIIGVNPNS